MVVGVAVQEREREMNLKGVHFHRITMCGHRARSLLRGGSSAVLTVKGKRPREVSREEEEDYCGRCWEEMANARMYLRGKPLKRRRRRMVTGDRV